MSADRPFHLGFFVDSFRVPGWATRWEGTSSADWMKGGFFVDLARAAERACMDMVLIADNNYIPDIYGGNHDWSLRYGRETPIHDPSVLVPVLTEHTRHIGFLPTLSVTEWHPYALARYLATADHLSGGRVGWNMVTSGNDRAAQNFGFPAQPPHDVRYDMADEFATVVRKLLGSWEPDAVVMDHDAGVYGDGAKVHPIDHVGTYYSSRGPLTTLPPSPGGPVICQAGASPKGQTIAARHADLVITSEVSIEGLKRYRSSLDERLAAEGRKPDDCRLFILVEPVIGDSDAEAHERLERADDEARMAFELRMSQMSSHWGIDLGKFDLDAPLPEDLRTNNLQGVLDAAIRSKRPLGELIGAAGGPNAASKMTVSVVGSPATAAAQLAEIVEEVGAEGVLIIKQVLDRRFVSEVTDGLVPQLQRMGLTRGSYSGTTFRENLFAF